MKARLADIVGIVGLASITAGAAMAELWMGFVVGGASALFVSWRIGAPQ
jgi:hypothetical protein